MEMVLAGWPGKEVILQLGAARVLQVWMDQQLQGQLHAPLPY